MDAILYLQSLILQPQVNCASRTLLTIPSFKELSIESICLARVSNAVAGTLGTKARRMQTIVTITTPVYQALVLIDGKEVKTESAVDRVSVILETQSMMQTSGSLKVFDLYMGSCLPKGRGKVSYGSYLTRLRKIS